MIFGAKSSPSSAMYVKNKMANENNIDFPVVADAVIGDMYMDDLLHGGRDEQEASLKIDKFIKLFKRGGFEICNWASNSKNVLASIPSNLRAKGFMELNSEASNMVERVLGLRWSANQDSFLFELIFHKVKDDVLSGLKIPSKREVLRLVMSIFDPMGFLAHYVIRAKILFQHIWLSKIGWDDQLTTNQNQQWQLWLKKLKNIQCVRIPRCYSPSLEIAEKVELHTFVDASQEAMAAVSYLVLKVGDSFETAFILGRTRVAPTKPLSVPRLELQAAILGTRMAETISEEIKLSIDV
ncbi:unnamed protein product [Allacma fusca]|uniref:Uncharacterized protein n=1 Tax=Allacma fusca TaxID=39272 RepID=A0A8J2NZ59_9HEXA|nr:unnamed protein product [Allacma fusca]